MLSSYLKIAFKVLLRRKAHTAISLFGITFTLLTLIVAAALIDHALGPAGPGVGRHDRILVSEGKTTDVSGETESIGLGPRLLDRFFRDLPGAEAMAIYLEAVRVRAYRDGARVDLGLKRTDAAFWTILPFRFLEGEPYRADDVREARPLAVISESTRRRLFDGAPAVGRLLELEGQRFRVVGVAPDVSPLRQSAWADVWAPLTTSRRDSDLGDLSHHAQALVLAASPADFPRLQAEASQRAARYDPPDPRDHGPIRVTLRTARQRLIDDLGLSGKRREGDNRAVKVPRLALAALVISLLFMLLPTVNLINLNVSRILERAPEIGVRKAFGASSRTLVGQFVIENVVLTAIGGLLALLLATFVLGRLQATGLFGAESLTISHRVFLVGMALATLFGLVSGVYPAWKMARMHPLQALRGAAR